MRLSVVFFFGINPNKFEQIKNVCFFYRMQIGPYGYEKQVDTTNKQTFALDSRNGRLTQIARELNFYLLFDKYKSIKQTKKERTRRRREPYTQ